MRGQFWTILAMAVLVAMVTGCGGAHRYDSRLTAADSLMRQDPDSALAVLNALPDSAFAAEGDRAYRALLLTQARYKAYVTATSDSDINRALDYYRRHSGEREKLTRAYIYKGAVMEELGHPDSAMLYYKYAEATADPNDYFNLGYSKLRIAELYQLHVSQDSAAINRLKDAIHYFSALCDTNYLIICYGDLGAICGVRYPDSTEYFLTKAIQLSQSYNPSLQYSFKSKLAGFNLFYKKNYKNANLLSMDVVKNGNADSDELSFYYYAALSYIHLGRVDSAALVFDMAPAPQNPVDSMLYYEVLAELAKTKNSHKTYGESVSKNKEITVDFIEKLQEDKLIAAEVEYDRLQLERQNSTIISDKNKLGLVLLAAIFLLLCLAFLSYRFYQRVIKAKHEAALIQSELEQLRQQIVEDNKDNKDKDIAALVNYRFDALRELYQCIRVKIPKSENRVKRIIPLSSFLQLMNQRKELLQVDLGDSFWEKMKKSVDGEYKGIVTFVEKHYPNLTEDELKVFCLLCAGISPQIIRICMNFTNAKTVTNYRTIIIKKKMGLDMKFEDFVQAYMNGELL